jgi:hypothetical protein
MAAVNGTSPLRLALDDARAELGCSMKDLTVLAAQNDPFRIDTPARHRDGEWLADTLADPALGVGALVHLRGLHYAISNCPDKTFLKPDGTPYINNDDDWLWLSEKACKAGRWLGYIPFERIVDHRNTAPTIRINSHPDPYPYLTAGLDVDIPDADDLVPRVGIDGFAGVQPYKLVLFGEKSSLEPVLDPISVDYDTDLYLTTGEISDTLLHTMARVGADDGRPMVVLCFSDCDPAGWQMPISIGRKQR